MTQPAVNRRDLLKAGVAVIGLPAMTRAEQIEQKLKQFEGIAPQPEVIDTIHPPEDQLKDWSTEILRFADDLGAAALPKQHEAVSVPFATMPCNRYLYTPKGIEEAGIKPPDIDDLRVQICDASPYAAQFELQCLVNEVWLAWFPEAWEWVQNLTVRSPHQDRVLSDRIITPRYVVDVEEITNVHVGLAVILPVVDLLTELQTKLDAAWYAIRTCDLVNAPEGNRPSMAARTSHPADTTALEADHRKFVAATVPLATLPTNLYEGPETFLDYRERMQVKLPRVWSTKRAYLWEYFVYTTAAGVIATTFADE